MTASPATTETTTLPAALEMRGISKRFGNLEALSCVSLKLKRGSIHALLGENGAGKTTLMQIAFGMIHPDEGEILVDGVVKTRHTPAGENPACKGNVQHQYMLAPEMTVAENVQLGSHGRYDARRAAERVRSLSQQVGLALDPSAKVSTLSVVAQQRLEIVKALARDARILILDEPTAVLAPAEAHELLVQIRRLALDGRSVVLITHKLRDAREYADDVSVLRHGVLIASGPMATFTEDSIADAMLGQAAQSAPIARPSISVGDAVMSLNGVGLIRPDGVRSLRAASLDVHAGEIVGVAALEGGAADLMRVLAGRRAPSEGVVTIPSSVGFVPEDRLHDASIPGFKLYENVALTGSGRRTGRMRWADTRKLTATLLGDFDVRANDVNMRMDQLSGGNQQKLILAREMADNPSALVVENPTRGLDIQSSTALHQRLREARQRGCAIVFYSSDIEELTGLASRVVVVRDGTLVTAGRSVEEIGHALLKSPVAESQPLEVES